MATLHQLEKGILDQVTAVTRGVVAGNRLLDVQAAIGWPSENKLMDIARRPGGVAAIAVYDRKISKDSTRWMPYTLGTDAPTPGLTRTLSNDIINPSASVELTVGGVPIANDAIAVVLEFFGADIPQTDAQVVILNGSETLPAIASSIAAAINGDDVLSTWVSAVAAGPVVTITNTLGAGHLGVAANIGNQAIETREIGRRNRQIQIVIWARTEEERNAVGDRIDQLVAVLSSQFGIQLPDGTWARLLYVNDHSSDDATLNDVLRRDFFVSADYAITSRDVLYAVLAPIPQFAVF